MPQTLRKAVALVALLTVTTLGLGCTETDSGGSPTAPQALYLLIITNIWVDEADGEHTFNLFSNDDGSVEGDFEGEETLPDFTFFEITGRWQNNRVEFTVNRPTPVTYTATLSSDNPNRLVFSSSEGSLVLVR